MREQAKTRLLLLWHFVGLSSIVATFVLGMLLLFGFGCGNPQTVEASITMADRAGTVLQPPPRVQQLLDDAERITGYQIVPVRNATIELEFVDTSDPVLGRTYRDPPCRYHVRSNYNRLVLAHELGHVLGLEHSDNLNDLMYPAPSFAFLSGFQRHDMKDQADRFERWCWDSSEPLHDRSSGPEVLCELTQVGPLEEFPVEEDGTESSSGTDATKILTLEFWQSIVGW